MAERLRGRTLRTLIREEPSPSRSWVLEVGIQVAVALSDVHSRGVIHRDLKPSNIFIVETAAIPLLAKVIDFGLSQSPQHATAAGRLAEMAGTPGYMSPEVGAGQYSSPASDIYSLGITLYELATGTHPFPRKTVEEAMTAALAEEPLIESRFPTAFRQLLLDMMERDYRSRPSASECLARLWQANRELNESKKRAEPGDLADRRSV